MKIKYEAEDGKIFSTEEECLQHDYKTKVDALIIEIIGAITVNLEYFNGELTRSVEMNEERLYELITDFVKEEGRNIFIKRLRYEDEQRKVIGRLGL